MMKKITNEEIKELEALIDKKENEIAELQKQLEKKISYLNRVKSQLKDEIEEEKAKRESLPKKSIDEKIKEFEEAGFKVERNGEWLWKVGYDGRYDKELKGEFGTTMIDRNSESKKLKELGFQYSSNRQQWYYIHK